MEDAVAYRDLSSVADELRAKLSMQPEHEAPMLLITTVDIGGGKSDKIQLRRGEDPEHVARAFVAKHGLPSSVVQPLTAHILENMRKSKHLDMAEPVQEEEEVEQESSAPELIPAAGQKLSFANGMNDRLYEQLSAKLLPANTSQPGLFGSTHLLSVNNSMGAHPMTSRPGDSIRASSASNFSERPFRKSQSAEPSPRVHNRLYKQAVDLRSKQEARRRIAQEEERVLGPNKTRSSMSWISQEMMRERGTQFDNYGEMLYAEGLESIATRQAKAAITRAEREARELDGVTFAPEITHLAASLWAGEDVESQPVWSRLSVDKRAKTLERIREWAVSREQQELKECTFQPRICRTSVAMMSVRSGAQKALQVSAHEQLYADAMRRNEKMEGLRQWLPDEATFKPVINHTNAAEAALRRSLDALGMSAAPQPGSQSPEKEGARSQVVERLYMSMEKSKVKLEERREVLNGDVDPNTGRQLYRPQVGRGPRNMVGASREGGDIGELLYAAGQEAAARKEMQLENERAAEKEAANTHRATSVSQKLYDRLRGKRFTQIFEYLDECETGVLDLVALVQQPTPHMENLDNEVRDDVEVAAQLHAAASGVPLSPGEPALASAEGEGEASALPAAPLVDLPAFAALMEAALARRRKPRAYLVPSPSAKYQANHTFQPAINARSKAMAARLRPAELALHEVLHHNAETVRARLELARKDADAATLATCTFAPRLNTNANVEGRAIRASLAAIANPGRPLPRTSPEKNGGGGSPTVSGAPARGGRGGPAVAVASVLASSDEMAQFLALEREVAEALACTDEAAERIDALVEGTTPTNSSSPTPVQLRDTEALLTELLSSISPDRGGAVNAAVLMELQQYLATTEVQSASAKVVVVSGAAPVKEVAGMYVVAQGGSGGPAPGVRSRTNSRPVASPKSGAVLDALSSTLSQWDHLT